MLAPVKQLQLRIDMESKTCQFYCLFNTFSQTDELRLLRYNRLHSLCQSCEIFCLGGNLAFNRSQEGIFVNQRSHPFQPCFHLCPGEVWSSAAMRRLLRIFMILFSFGTISSFAGKFSLTFL